MDTKEGEASRNVILIGVIFLLIITLFSTVSASFLGNFTNFITGRASSATTTASIVIGADAPNVSLIKSNATNGTFTIVEGGQRTLEFTVIINDTNGDMNITNTSGGGTGPVTANFSKSGETTRTNNSCLMIAGNSSGGNWSCSIILEFYDDAGSWQISVQATDNVSNKAQNNSGFFSLQETTSMNMSVSALTFPAAGPGQSNITSDADPNRVQNTGNKDYLNFSITGINLLGDTSSATLINAGNFTVNNYTSTGAAPLECTNNTIRGTRLFNNTAINIEGANVTRSAQSNNSLYFCLTNVPTSLTTQTYSTGGTPNEDDWTITAS